MTFQGPFKLEGEFGFSGQPGRMFWHVQGAGLATAIYDFFPLEASPGHIYTLRSITYDFRNPNAPPDPVPEPAPSRCSLLVLPLQR